MRRFKPILNILKNKEFNKKIQLYFASKVANEDFDPEEKNYSAVELNPIVVEGIVSMISPEALVWKQYGLASTGAVELLVDSVHKNKFLNCSRVVIDGEDYHVWREGTGGKALIQDRKQGGYLRIILQKK